MSVEGEQHQLDLLQLALEVHPAHVVLALAVLG